MVARDQEGPRYLLIGCAAILDINSDSFREDSHLDAKGHEADVTRPGLASRRDGPGPHNRRVWVKRERRQR